MLPRRYVAEKPPDPAKKGVLEKKKLFVVEDPNDLSHPV